MGASTRRPMARRIGRAPSSASKPPPSSSASIARVAHVEAHAARRLQLLAEARAASGARPRRRRRARAPRRRAPRRCGCRAPAAGRPGRRRTGPPRRRAVSSVLASRRRSRCGPRVVGRATSAPRFEVIDDDDVGEVDGAPAPVGHAALVEDLEERLEHVAVRLLDLVEEQHLVGALAHGLGELPAGLVADVAGRRADEARDGVRLGVLAEVEAGHRVRRVEEALGDGLRGLGLADAGGAEQQERADGALGRGSRWRCGAGRGRCGRGPRRGRRRGRPCSSSRRSMRAPSVSRRRSTGTPVVSLTTSATCSRPTSVSPRRRARAPARSRSADRLVGQRPLRHVAGAPGDGRRDRLGREAHAVVLLEGRRHALERQHAPRRGRARRPRWPSCAAPEPGSVRTTRL